MDVDKQGNVWVVDARVGDARRAEEVSGLGGQGPHGHQVQPAKARCCWCSARRAKTGNPPDAFTEPNDVAHRARRQHLRRPSRTTRSSSMRIAPDGVGRISKFSPDGKFIKSFGAYGYGPASSAGRTRSRSTRAAGCSSPIAATAASRSSIRKASTSTRGISSAASAGSTSTANDTLYAIDSESDDNYNPGWRKGLRVGSAQHRRGVVLRARARVEAGLGHGRLRLDGRRGRRWMRRATSTPAKWVRSRA